jgi:Peptidase family C25
MGMAKKAIFVDGQALEAKYGDRAADVWVAVDRLIEADANRGIQTQLIKLDDPSGPAGGMASGAGWAEVKGEIDAILAASGHDPDYMMLLGGPDLLPHCELDNPSPGDGDAKVPSDLPYASATAASTTAADFIAPTRVVSRLPDVPGATNPEVLLEELEVAIGWTARPPRLYDARLGISADVWKGSTELSLTQLFGSAEGLRLSPPEGPSWGSLLGCRSHFANLHGSPRSTRYFGQSGGSYPVAHDAAIVEGQLENGTIAAVEACYGAELFEPDDQLPMPLSYLRSGAYAFFGASTIAYGPTDANDYADVICRLFLEALLQGASIGRAGLEARQQYVAQSAPLDPVDLKTVAQFLILGDPSVQPVLRFDPGRFEEVEGPKPEWGPKPEERRERLREMGAALEDVARWAEPLESAAQQGVVASLQDLSVLVPGVQTSVSSFGLVGAPGFHALPAAAGEVEAEVEAEPATMHVLMQEIESRDAPMPQRVVVLAVEAAGQVISVKTATTR